MQRIDGRLRPIAYTSRKLNAAETRYSVTDLEALAVSQSGRQARWIDTLLEFNPVIRYTPGASNKVADSLSRLPTLHLDILDKEDVKSRQRQDPTYGELIGILELDPSATLPRRPHVPTSKLYLEGDLLFRRSSPHKQQSTRQRHTYKQLVIPEDLVPTILRLLHEAPTASHAGADKAIKFARERYFFPRMASRITEHIRSCQVCPLHKGSTTAPAPALTYDVPDRPFQRVSVDILSGFSTSTSGCKYLLVFIDAFSRFCELAPIPDNIKKVNVDHLNTLTHDLILAVHGSVMPSLIPPSALESFIRRISAETRFTPLFSMANATLLYSLLESFITPHDVRVHSFPLPLNGSFYGLSPDHDIILRSLDHTSLSFISSPALSSCSSVLSRFHACFDVFPPEHSYFHSSCHKALLSDGDVQSSCLFNQLNSTSPFLLTLPDLHLLYFFSATHVSISCGSNHADREVSAAFLLPRSWQLSAKLISLHSSHSFHFAYSPATPTLPPMSLDLPVTNVSLPLANVRMLPSYRDDVPDLLTFAHSPHVTFGFPVLSTAIGLAIAICGFLLYRHLTIRRLRIVSSASSVRDDPSTHQLSLSVVS
ncbi:hypothetical protein C7M84_011388 [Penaeus vannamei]|uniref:RNA-directed DNA polymerase n=1 Tax=Penaeus vannamei TaxID=6689 RepID=A0A3R7NYI7_PENVA|nr:hypothetical protein C7M84_011388 [Penaeus vannamei]